MANKKHDWKMGKKLGLHRYQQVCKNCGATREEIYGISRSSKPHYSAASKRFCK